MANQELLNRKETEKIHETPYLRNPEEYEFHIDERINLYGGEILKFPKLLGYINSKLKKQDEEKKKEEEMEFLENRQAFSRIESVDEDLVEELREAVIKRKNIILKQNRRIYNTGAKIENRPKSANSHYR